LARAQDAALAQSQAAVDPVLDARYHAFAETFGVSVDQAIRADSGNHYYFWLNWG
jgi:hypothetical protein